MTNLTLTGNKGKVTINSKDVLNTLKSNPFLNNVRDISNTINQEEVLAFDCRYEESYYESTTYDQEERELEEIMQHVGASGLLNIRFEDIRNIVKDCVDEVEAELQEVYKLDNLRCHFYIYSFDQYLTDIRFVILISFEDSKYLSMINLASIIAQRQLDGQSKFYS
ncbi:MAG: hypothetical protein LBN09_05315 [Clostridioides sp.]|jgi:hypothetical protein|nr:hypothetical protein [Clostridioides sp.]